MTAEVIANLNALPRGKTRLFGRTVIRRDAYGGWWLMNSQAKGWDSHGYHYPSIEKLIAKWNIVVTGFGGDIHSFYYTVE